MAIRNGKRSSYVIGIGVNPGVGLVGKFLVALELAPKWVLLAGQVGVRAGAWGAPSGWAWEP